MTDADRPLRPSHGAASRLSVLRARERHGTVQPGERSRLPVRRRVAAYVLAIVLPAAVAAAMIPIRVDHGRVAVVVLVLPVLFVAILGAIGPAIVAAVCAALAYDLFLVEPYYSFTIDETDEIVAALTLGAVGLVAGVLNARLVRLTARETARRRELRHLIAFLHTATRSGDEAELTGTACERLSAVLNLRSCEWRPGDHGSAAPVLLPDGNVMGFVSELNPDRAILPDRLELPVTYGGTELGRFLLSPTPRHIASHEERLTAASIAELYGQAVGRIASQRA